MSPAGPAKNMLDFFPGRVRIAERKSVGPKRRLYSNLTQDRRQMILRMIAYEKENKARLC